ncbi:MAG: NHL repeat-containing protein [Coriobacteriia bacterium]
MTSSENKTELSKFIADKERRGKTKKLIALALLVLLLVLLAWAGMYYSANRRLPIPFLDGAREEIQPPQFLYAISGPEGPDALTKPIGVCVTDDDRAYIVDDRMRGVRVYTSEGRYLFKFNAIESEEATRLLLPGDVAESPSGEIWVTDRRLRGVFIFAKDGAFLREYVPEGDGPSSWGPISVSFDAEGNVYVVDIGTAEKHRVFAYDSSGAEIATWGSTIQADNLEASPSGFYFPNASVVSASGDVFVADSNNRRVQVFDKTGEFKAVIPTSGTPRGLAIDSEQRLLVVDALAHTVDVYTLDGRRLTAFGTPGVGLGQFQFPNDVALDKRGRIFVTDPRTIRCKCGDGPPMSFPRSSLRMIRPSGPSACRRSCSS